MTSPVPLPGTRVSGEQAPHPLRGHQTGRRAQHRGHENSARRLRPAGRRRHSPARPGAHRASRRTAGTRRTRPSATPDRTTNRVVRDRGPTTPLTGGYEAKHYQGQPKPQVIATHPSLTNPERFIDGRGMCNTPEHSRQIRDIPRPDHPPLHPTPPEQPQNVLNQPATPQPTPPPTRQPSTPRRHESTARGGAQGLGSFHLLLWLDAFAHPATAPVMRPVASLSLRSVKAKRVSNGYARKAATGLQDSPTAVVAMAIRRFCARAVPTTGHHAQPVTLRLEPRRPRVCGPGQPVLLAENEP